MELAKDNIEPATQRDIRDMQSLMLAGFEVCIELLTLALQNQAKGDKLTPGEIDSIIYHSREKFLIDLEARRAKYFLNDDI